ncbi:MAG TPA: nitrile hydratase subunit beta [Alphaproteobacteria bacterium]|jgi:nitrile hydratase|nr:nitrile hydratase subunit beta [Alphaproteobacteria bacterium]MDP6271627.1 nitrile hydratase subunit beta [Alphaproteobacteria bacterium]MDP7164050.1 nitrile hydratase subunit beta [Alphaproteobacteria bacterium]MDP7426679.1 nitrile hydratase subunit beta [Alphaproteobacteria bacterium]HJM49142.1 nitrile hydratase subunit beta [Alphaproteobacteria bacterium]
MSIVDLETVRGLYKDAGASRLDLDIAPRFKPGDAVRARTIEPAGHTRLAGYVRGKQGVVERDHGVFHLPDSRVAGDGDKPQHIYSVRFRARDLWGPEAAAQDSLNIDLWDDYLDPA